MEEVYLPEGKRIGTLKNRRYLSGEAALRQACAEGLILEAVARMCDGDHSLIFDLGGVRGIIPRAFGALGIEDGSVRDIAILSRVGRPTCFKVLHVDSENGETVATLSRSAAQREAVSHMLEALSPGTVIPAVVTHLERFGAFVDVGCGVSSFIGIENISVSRIGHPADRFSVDQDILAVVTEVIPQLSRIKLSHRELLGTWEENVARFPAGCTVAGIVRSVEPYGVFIELSPNLSGLAEPHTDLSAGERVSVYIKSAIPEQMKLKLAVVAKLPEAVSKITPEDYFITGGRIKSFVYSPAACHAKVIRTDFGL